MNKLKEAIAQAFDSAAYIETTQDITETERKLIVEAAAKAVMPFIEKAVKDALHKGYHVGNADLQFKGEEWYNQWLLENIGE
jgi:hypothetical protein